MSMWLGMRLADPDDFPYARPVPRRSFEDALNQALQKAYPVAPVVEGVDDVLIRILDKMATLEMGRKSDD